MKRRSFIKAGGVAGAALAFPSVVRAAAGQKIRMGFIGVGNRGTQVLHLFMNFPEVEVTALCDIYDPYLKRSEKDFDPKFLEWGLKGRLPIFTKKDGSLHPHEQRILDDVAAGRCKLYTDYRKLLEDKNVDAVYIATPDHWHAIMTIDAIKAGKDVYCEKPLTATVVEGRRMVEVEKVHKQVVCVGLNRRGCVPYQLLKKEIDSGKYGTFRMGRAARSSNIFPNGLGKCAPCDPPKGFDWDAWLGPRAWRPYKYTTAPYFFRWHTDFSSQVGNWGVHYREARDDGRDRARRRHGRRREVLHAGLRLRDPRHDDLHIRVRLRQDHGVQRVRRRTCQADLQARARAVERRRGNLRLSERMGNHAREAARVQQPRQANV